LGIAKQAKMMEINASTKNSKQMIFTRN